MVVLRYDKGKNRFNRVLTKNVNPFAVLDSVGHKSVVRDFCLNRRVVGVEIEILFKKALVVAFYDVLAALVGYARHMVFRANSEHIALLHETKDLSAIEGLSDVESRRFGD